MNEWIVLANHREVKMLLIIVLNWNSISESIIACRTACTVVTWDVDRLFHQGTRSPEHTASYQGTIYNTAFQPREPRHGIIYYKTSIIHCYIPYV